MKNRLDELHLSRNYVAKYLNITPEILDVIEKDIDEFSKEQKDKLNELIGARTLWRDDSDEAEIERLKKLRSK